jgi:phospholipid-binding lipoprotein MlaA
MKILPIIFLLYCTINTSVLAEEYDPFEDINRVTHGFNDVFDDYIFEPVAASYMDNVPDFAQGRVSDFFDNLRDVKTLANQLLQFKIIGGVETFGRIVVNTSVGLGGLFDVASSLNLDSKNEDFGQTLAFWGIPQGPYIVLPFLGPSTLRDGVGIIVDSGSDAEMINKLSGIGFVSTNALKAIDKRVELFPVSRLLENYDDSYTFMRSSYIQSRQYDIFDGNPPITDDDF